jgi:hypothetical protein
VDSIFSPACEVSCAVEDTAPRADDGPDRPILDVEADGSGLSSSAGPTNALAASAKSEKNWTSSSLGTWLRIPGVPIEEGLRRTVEYFRRELLPR